MPAVKLIPGRVYDLQSLVFVGFVDPDGTNAAHPASNWPSWFDDQSASGYAEYLGNCGEDDVEPTFESASIVESATAK